MLFGVVAVVFFLVFGNFGKMGLRVPFPTNSPFMATAFSFGMNFVIGLLISRFRKRRPAALGGPGAGVGLLMGWVFFELSRSSGFAHDYGFHEISWTLQDPDLLGLAGVSSGGAAGLTLGLGAGGAGATGLPGPQSVDQMIKDQVDQFQNQYGGGPTTGPDVVCVVDTQPRSKWPDGTPKYPIVTDADPLWGGLTAFDVRTLQAGARGQTSNNAINAGDFGQATTFWDYPEWANRTASGLMNTYGSGPSFDAAAATASLTAQYGPVIAGQIVAKANVINALNTAGIPIPNAAFGIDPDAFQVIVNPPPSIVGNPADPTTWHNQVSGVAYEP